MRLGANSTYQATISKLSRPIVETLWRKSGETINLGVLEGREVLYLDVIESPHNFRLASQVGMRRPLHCTALGKAILAWLPANSRDELLAIARFERVTHHSIIRPAELVAELGRIQRRGYAIDNEEVELGARCVAAPILDSSWYVAAAISVAGPITRMSRNRTFVLASAVKGAALEISRYLGYNGAPSNHL
jgi:DNA-binding IclR family transcriptional regulator